MARGRVCNFIVVVSTCFGRLGRRFAVRLANTDLCGIWDRFWWSVVVGVCCGRSLCLIPNCLHNFLSAIMLSQCCCLCFCLCLFVARFDFVHVSICGTDGVGSDVLV